MSNDNIHESPTLTVMQKYFTKETVLESEFPFNLQAFCNELDEIQFKMMWLVENGRPAADLTKVQRDAWVAGRKDLGFGPEKERSRLILVDT